MKSIKKKFDTKFKYKVMLIAFVIVGLIIGFVGTFTVSITRFYFDVFTYFYIICIFILVSILLVIGIVKLNIFKKILLSFLLFCEILCTIVLINIFTDYIKDIPNAMNSHYLIAEGEIKNKNINKPRKGNKYIKFEVNGVQFKADNNYFDVIKNTNKVRIQYLPITKQIILLDTNYKN